jgi:hypothetical protein
LASRKKIPNKSAAKRKPKIGAPSKYSDELAKEMCDRLAAGESLASICRDDAMPSASVVREWAGGLTAAVPASFPAQYERARLLQADHYFEEILEIADGAAIAADAMGDYAAEGVKPEHQSKAHRRAYHEEINARKLRIDSRKWTLGRMNRAKYGERTDLGVGQDPSAAPVEVEQADTSHLTPDEKAEMRKLARKAITGKKR